LFAGRSERVKARITREEWLIGASSHLAELISEAGMTCPPVAVSIGFPRRRGGQSSCLGECWAGQMSSDGRPAIFISPILEDPIRILDVLLHELVHAAVGVEAGHRGRFVALARSCGLEGKATATVAGSGLRSRLNAVRELLGPLPHAALRPVFTASVGSRLRLYECECKVKVRVASDAFDATCNACGFVFTRQT
jgi:hypothetical protein